MAETDTCTLSSHLHPTFPWRTVRQTVKKATDRATSLPHPLGWVRGTDSRVRLGSACGCGSRQHSPHHRLAPVYVEPLIELLDVVGGSVEADTERGGDFGFGQAAGQRGRNLALLRRQLQRAQCGGKAHQPVFASLDQDAAVGAGRIRTQLELAPGVVDHRRRRGRVGLARRRRRASSPRTVCGSIGQPLACASKA